MVKSQNQGILEKLKNKWEWCDWAFFFVLIPLVLLIIYLLPQELRDNYFILHTANPTIHTMLLSKYAHSDFSHFSVNLLAYLIWLLSIFSLLFIFPIESEKKTFYISSFLFFILLPFILSGLTILYYPSTSSQGFSGITSAFLGYLVYLIYIFSNELKGRHPDYVVKTMRIFMFVAGLVICWLISGIGDPQSNVISHIGGYVFGIAVPYLSMWVLDHPWHPYSA